MFVLDGIYVYWIANDYDDKITIIQKEVCIFCGGYVCPYWHICPQNSHYNYDKELSSTLDLWVIISLQVNIMSPAMYIKSNESFTVKRCNLHSYPIEYGTTASEVCITSSVFRAEWDYSVKHEIFQSCYSLTITNWMIQYFKTYI